MMCPYSFRLSPFPACSVCKLVSDIVSIKWGRDGRGTCPCSLTIHDYTSGFGPFPFYENIDKKKMVINLEAYKYNDADDRCRNEIEEIHIHSPQRNAENSSVRPQIVRKSNQRWGGLLTMAPISYGDSLLKRVDFRN